MSCTPFNPGAGELGAMPEYILRTEGLRFMPPLGELTPTAFKAGESLLIIFGEAINRFSGGD